MLNKSEKNKNEIVCDIKKWMWQITPWWRLEKKERKEEEEEVFDE